MVPNGWTQGKVKNLVKSLDAGISVNSDDDGNLDSKFKILKTSCVSGNSFDSTKVKSVVKQNEIARLKEPVLADSIIISRMNTPALVGANGYVEKEITNTYLPDRLWQLKPYQDKVSMRWLGYWFSSSPTRHQLSATATGTSGSMKNITKADVLNININIPPLHEQQKIAKILSTWDKAIETTERLIDNSKQQKKALMQQLLTGKKRLLDDNGKRFEDEWEERKISDFGSIYSGGTPSTSKSTYWDGDIDWITPTDITKQDKRYISSSKRRITKEGLKNSSAKLVPEGSLLVCTRATIGAMAITSHEMCTNQGFKNIVPNNDYDIEFIYYLLSFNPNQLIRRASGSTFLELSKSEFESIKFKTPKLKEQQKIAAVLTNADKEIELLEQQLADLKQEKKALMQVLLTGKVRVGV